MAEQIATPSPVVIELGNQVMEASHEAAARISETERRIAVLNEVGSWALKGVVIKEMAFEALESERSQAEADFSVLNAMAIGIPSTNGHKEAEVEQTPSEPEATEPTSPVAETSSAPAKPESANGKVSWKEKRDDTLLFVLSAGGRIESLDGKSAGLIVTEEVGLSANQWATIRNKSDGLFEIDRVSPESRRFKAVSVDMEKMAELAESGDTSQDVIEAYQELIKDTGSNGNGSTASAEKAESSFLE